jgi:hypothetical protein
MTDEIIITETEENQYGTGVSVQGEFPGYPGWTFEASVKPEPDFSSDCRVCNYGRVVDVSLFHEGEVFYSCPGDDYDGRTVSLTAEHYRMFDLIDRHFPPSPEERKAMLAERDRITDGIADRLDELRRTEFADVADDVFRLALRKAATRLSSL